MFALIRAAKLNGIESRSWLRDVLGGIGIRPINRLEELLPWNWQPQTTRSAAA